MLNPDSFSALFSSSSAVAVYGFFGKLYRRESIRSYTNRQAGATKIMRIDFSSIIRGA